MTLLGSSKVIWDLNVATWLWSIEWLSPTFHQLATRGSMLYLAAQDHIANPTGANIITNFGFGN